MSPDVDQLSPDGPRYRVDRLTRRGRCTQPAPQWLTIDQAIKHCTHGLGIWESASNERGSEPEWHTDDVNNRVPQPGTRTACFKHAILETLIGFKQHIATQGDDLPVISRRKWGLVPSGEAATCTERDND